MKSSNVHLTHVLFFFDNDIQMIHDFAGNKNEEARNWETPHLTHVFFFLIMKSRFHISFPENKTEKAQNCETPKIGGIMALSGFAY